MVDSQELTSFVNVGGDVHGGGVVRDGPPEVWVDIEIVRDVASPAWRLLHLLRLVYLQQELE